VATKKGTTKKEFTFKYIIPDHIQDCYVNGAFGGVTPTRKILSIRSKLMGLYQMKYQQK